MKIFKKPIYHRIRLGLLSLALVFSTVIILVFLNSRTFNDGASQPNEPISSNPGIKIGNIQHTATRNGVTEWKLEARSAEYALDGDRAVFEDLTVTFFLEENGRAFVTAQKGVLDTKTYDIEVFGNVKMENEGYRLETEQLQYRHDNRMVYARTPVNLTGDGLAIVSDSLQMDLDTHRTRFKGHVKGTFHETSS
ncbi:MAG: LPS export ABC transporter periplasmic protein LptC [Desulfobacterales bacterium]